MSNGSLKVGDDPGIIPVRSFHDWLVHETIGLLVLTGICSIVLSGLINGVQYLALTRAFYKSKYQYNRVSNTVSSIEDEIVTWSRTIYYDVDGNELPHEEQAKAHTKKTITKSEDRQENTHIWLSLLVMTIELVIFFSIAYGIYRLLVYAGMRPLGSYRRNNQENTNLMRAAATNMAVQTQNVRYKIDYNAVSPNNPNK